jgi:protein tyrosine phosphatase (PTP) superfamily phosphohydrolase (DUF442 family)
MRNILLVIILVFTFTGCSKNPKIVHKKEWAKPVLAVKLENFYKVDEKLYRSAQPSAEEFKELEKFGIKYDLNLRQFHDDKKKLQGTKIKYYHIPINTSKMSYEQLVEAVAFLARTNAKTLVHCLHGSDRTGTVVAGYKIAVQGWEKQKAIDEFVNGGYGYHSFWFPNLPKLLESLDVEKFKQDIKNYKFQKEIF